MCLPGVFGVWCLGDWMRLCAVGGVCFAFCRARFTVYCCTYCVIGC